MVNLELCFLLHYRVSVLALREQRLSSDPNRFLIINYCITCTVWQNAFDI